MSDDRRWFDSDIGSAVACAVFLVGTAIAFWIVGNVSFYQSRNCKHAAPVEAPKEPR